jgi:hypothetical protein
MLIDEVNKIEHHIQDIQNTVPRHERGPIYLKAIYELLLVIIKDRLKEESGKPNNTRRR